MADTTPPKIVSIILPSLVDVRKNPLIEYGVHATDESGVAHVIFQFVEPLAVAVVPYPYTDVFYEKGVLTAATYSPGGAMMGSGYVVTYNPAGRYNIAQVLVTDYAHNTAVITAAELKAMGLKTSITLTGTTPDVAAPIPAQVQFPALVDISSGPVAVTIGANARDKVSGPTSLKITLETPVTYIGKYDFSPTAHDAFSFGDYWDSVGPLGAAATPTVSAAGVYNISSIVTTDDFYNTRTYTALELSRLGINTSMTVSNGIDVPNTLAETFELEAQADGIGGAITLKLSAAQWLAGDNKLSFTLDYDNKAVQFERWEAGLAGTYQVQADVVENSAGGTLTLDATINTDGERSDILELRFKPLAQNGSFSYDFWKTKVNGAPLANDFGKVFKFALPILRTGTAADDHFLAGRDDDIFYGLDGDDRFIGLAGNDTAEGGDGVDVAVYSASYAQYQLSHWGNFTELSASFDPGKAQRLFDVERIAFADLSLAFDDAAAQAFRLYQAAFKRAPEAAGLGFWIKALDSGMPLADVAGYFVASPEFSALYGDKPGNATLVEGFYLNALNRPGDADGLKFWSDLLDSKSISVAEMLVYFSESPENQLQTADIVGAGLPFIPFI